VILETTQRVLEVCIKEIKSRQESKLFYSCYLLCYTWEWVKSKEKEILQREQHSLYMQFVCHSRTVPHAPMYHPNLIPWSYTPPRYLIISTTTPHHPTSQHLRPLLYHTKLYCHHLPASSTSPNVSAFPLHNFFHTIPTFRSQFPSTPVLLQTVTLTITNFLTVTRENLLCSRWVNVSTLT